MTRRHARNDRKKRTALEPRGEQLDSRELLSGITAVVTTTLDGFVGVGGTLRDAIMEVDASPSPANSIVFEIPKSDPGYNPANGTFTINLVSELPDISNQVLLDGTSESTFLGEPALVVIDGASIKGPANGLIVAPSAPASTIEGVEVANFDGTGIITESSSNTIGGTSSRAGNILASNAVAGVSILETEQRATGGIDNLIVGNFIGTDRSGTNLGNGAGVIIGTANNTVGGTAAGAGNVIGFNTSEGILIRAANATANVILGNFIGTDANGDNLGNPIGVSIQSGSTTIGGTTAGSANVFGFSLSAGVQISGKPATNDLVVGNLFGTNANGAIAGNTVGLQDETGGNTIGGSSTGAANVFGFNNEAGVLISGSNDVVIGNLFGTNSNGTTMANADGLIVQSDSNTIGGVSAGTANTFGPSEKAGIQINGSSGSNNLVIGNYFGTNASGARFTNYAGMLVESPSNTIGGSSAGAGNVFGMSTSAALQFDAAAATNNVVLGNLFGTNSTGANLGNLIGLFVGSASNTVGGTTAGAANVFAYNSTAGATIAGDFATGNLLLGNLFGTNASNANFGNGVGVEIESGGNTLGGTSTGSANLISQNSAAGVEITGTSASNNTLIGNLIGTDSTGQTALGNGVGVLLSGGADNTIGGTTAGAANVISGNITAGIELQNSSVTGTQIVGNRIGTNPAGTNGVARADQPNLLLGLQNAGVVIIGSTGNSVGGTSPQAANLISGNYVGVMLATIAGGGSPNQVSGNLIGTDSSGSSALGNIVGIYINGASGNQIGGTVPGSANTVSGNSSVGVEIYGSGSTANLVEGNVIGLASDGHSALRTPSGQFVQPTGVFILNASGNVIGGASSAARNVISGNQNAGVYIFSEAGISRDNVVEQNLIGRASGGSPGPGNNGYGVLLLDSPKNQAGQKGAAANLFGRNRIANFRSLTGPPAAVPATAAKGRIIRDVRTSGPHHMFVHRAQQANPRKS